MFQKKTFAKNSFFLLNLLYSLRESRKRWNNTVSNRLRVGFLISGGGSTMTAVIKAIQSGRLSYAEPGCVIASNGSAGGLQKAAELGMASKDILVLKKQADFGGDEQRFGEAISKAMRTRGVNLIAQLGWLAHTPTRVISDFSDRIINQHPGPLDPGQLDFGGQGMHGLTVHQAVLNFAKLCNRPFPTEATIHRVVEQYDQGPVLGNLLLDISDVTTPEDLQSRLLPLEHQLVIQVVEQFSFEREQHVRRKRRLIWGDELENHQLATQAALKGVSL